MQNSFHQYQDIPEEELKQALAFVRLKKILDELREKCPWDKKQTISSLRQMTIEETYELADAISEENWKDIQEELGDLFLHLLFYAKIGTEQEALNLEGVFQGIAEKLIRRHPHIYGQVQADDAEAVKRNWEQIKLKEGKESVLSGIPSSLPALMKSLRIQEKAAQVGFDWKEIEPVRNKVLEEFQELQEAIAANNKQEIEAEMGDLFFSLVNYARFLHVDPENALEKTNKKFIRRFQGMENKAKMRGLSLPNLSLPEMDAIWDEMKREENADDTTV
jgi:MazG family protein